MNLLCCYRSIDRQIDLGHVLDIFGINSPAGEICPKFWDIFGTCLGLIHPPGKAVPKLRHIWDMSGIDSPAGEAVPKFGTSLGQL